MKRLLAWIRRVFCRKPPHPFDVEFWDGLDYGKPATTENDFERLNGQF